MADDIRDKIMKLLRLANDRGATEAEAANALAMASALMAKYGVEVSLKDDAESETVYGEWMTGGKWDKKWHIEVARAVGFLYAVKWVVSSPSGTFYFIGRPEVIMAAETTFYWIVEQVERLYKECLPRGLDKKTRAEYRRTFKYACASRLVGRAWEILKSLTQDDALAIAATGSTALTVKTARESALNEAQKLMRENSDIKSLTTKAAKPGMGSRFGAAAAELVKLQHGVDMTAGSDTDPKLQLEDGRERD